MRLLLFTSMICVLTACQTIESADEINFHAPVKIEWSLVEMKGLEDAYNRNLRPVDKPLSGPERLRSLTLVTKTHWEKPDLELVEFQACNRIKAFEGVDADAPVIWMGGGYDNYCGWAVHDAGIESEHMQNIHHRVFKVYYVAEEQFKNLVVQVERQRFNQDLKTLDLLDSEDALLMRFKRREVAE